MKRFILFICFCSLYLTGISQRTGTWKSYLAYYNTTLVAAGNNHVFAVGDGSLYSYNEDDNSVKYYAKETTPSLSDNNITSISFNTDQNVLIITYSNGNIDLLGSNGIINLPYLMDNGNIQDKVVNSIYNHNETAYLSAQFGILVLNLPKNEVKETYRFSNPVKSSVIHGDSLFAVTLKGIRKGYLNNNLIDPANWDDYTVKMDGIEIENIIQLCVFQNTLCYLVENKGVYYQTPSGIQQLLRRNDISNIKVENGKLFVLASKDLFIYSSFNENDRIKVESTLRDVSFLKNDTYWLAVSEEGLIGLKRTGSNQFSPVASNLNTEGPKRNYCDFLLMHNDKLYVAGGGRWSIPLFRRGTAMIYNTTEQTWTNLNHITDFWNYTRDATSIAVNPTDENNYFISTWGYGIYNINNNELKNHYDNRNSILNSSLGDDAAYVRVEGLAYDNNNNLWMTNSGVANTIKVLKADGSWASLYYSDISSATLADKILIMNNGDKWVNLVRADKSGIFVFNDNGTIEDISDDDFYHFSSLDDAQGSIGAEEYFCVTKDKNDQIWIGTNRGPVIVYNPLRVLDNKQNTVFNRIIHTDENGIQDYFLKDERVRAIAVDGGNRKWIGTASSGAYLLSEDGTQIIEHFTTENSPLLSNDIMSIAINNKTGEVFFGTTNGLISYWGDATEGSADYSNVYAYPNPVRPDFDHKVIITGLMENSNVKITDVRGNLIYQGRSMGGQISWDCRNSRGRQVAAGVYLVLSSTPEGKESVVTKIAVVQ